MEVKHNIPVIFSISLLLLVLVSSFSAPQNNHNSNTLVLTSLSAAGQTKLEALSWDTQEYYSELSESEHTTSGSASRLSLSVKLYNVDSLSPAGTSPESLFKNRLQRDALRANTLFAITKSSKAASGDFSSPVSSGYSKGSGEYFTRIAVGSPPKYFYMIMDTGSDIIWLQCLPCKKCYKQEDAFFNPNKSSSFSVVLCGSQLCHLLDYSKCGKLKQCLYREEYGDGSVSDGDFSTETLTFGKKTKVPKVAFGCGHSNKGLFVAADGLLGLGRGKPSFPVQAGSKKFGNNKFSYCLGEKTSQLIFGDSSSVYRNASFTPLVTNPVPELNTFYYVGLEGISVGGSHVKRIKASLFDFDRKSGDGGVIVDSGTSVTRLTRPAYLALRKAFRKGTSKLKRISNISIFDTCYNLSRTKEVEVPTVDLHFRGGANMSLPAANYMIPVVLDNNATSFCFAFAGTDGGLSIIGNIQQLGFGMVFDLAKKQVGFAPNACS